MKKLTAIRPSTLVIISIVIGLLISIFWSPAFVDKSIGDTIANSILGFNAKETAIDSALIGAIFALVTGLAGTFTACNICAFSALGPLAEGKQRTGRVITPLLWLIVGIIIVSALYGAIGVMISSSLPQLSQIRLGDPANGLPIRIIQASIVFFIIGAIYFVWGLTSLKVVRNPFRQLTAGKAWLPPLFMGLTIGTFLIGRPFPLFRKMFEYAASLHNPFYGSAAFILQSLGNILLTILIFLFLIYGTKGKFEKWLTSDAKRLALITGMLFIISGTFFMSYWGPRIYANNGLIFWPYFDWENHDLKFKGK